MYAVVGASTDKEKYGHKVFKHLLERGELVVPVNPREKEILGRRCYASLSVVPHKIDVVVFVTQPYVTNNVLLEVKKLHIKKVWMQPGSENEEAIAFCTQNGISCTHNACIMLSARE